MTTTTLAATLLARLDANVDGFYADAITFAEFGKRNRRIWAAIEAAGPSVRAEVDSALRARP